ncbi:MAG: hypothetical protein BMS9Abin07_2206 [Acidimicrobiia bacterium]|nr:MAG: hypothetical protein BMS9Abin07_2206 [Acidimicrobiia bacterium]
MTRRAFLVIAAAAVTLLLASCRAEINIALDVEEDASGTLVVEFGVDEELRSLMESNGADPDELFSKGGTGFEGGTTFQRDEGDMSFQGFTVEFDDVEEISDQLAGGGGDVAQFGAFSFELSDNEAVFDATLAAEEQDLAELPFDPTGLTGDVLSANFILGMPGTVVEHNADEVLADGRLSWDLPFFGGEKSLHAVSDLGGSGFPWLWLLLGIALLVGVMATIAAIVLGKRQQRQAVADAAAAYPQQVPVAQKQETPIEPDDGEADDAGSEAD